jgi:adenylate cyclase
MLALVGIGCFFTLIIILIQPFNQLNLWVSDQFFTTESPSPNIVIAGIDDESLETYGRWSEWSRTLHANAINNLNEAGAKVIGFDIIFADSSSDDPTLAAAIAKANNVVLASVGTQSAHRDASGITFDNFLLPTVSLGQVASSLGTANVMPDSDGTVRRLYLVVKDQHGNNHPAFTLAVLHTLFSMPLPKEYSIENKAVHLLARDIPVDSVFGLRINFAAENASRPYISYADVIKGDFDPSLVKNKIVLIGMTATGELDTWAIPTSVSQVPGVFIHATAMDTILRQQFLTETSIAITLMLMLAIIGIMAISLPRCGTWYWTDIAKGLGITIALFISLLIGSFIAFDNGNIINILYPSLILSIIYISNLLYMILIAQRDKRFVKELFGRYISPQIAKEIVSQADSGNLTLGGEQREVTVLFADIRNFTQISEQMSP